MRLFDVHVHLQEEEFYSDLPQVVERALIAGVEFMACCGTSPQDWQRVEKITQEYNRIFPFYGLHPWFINEAQGNWKNVLEEKLDSSKCGIGETGLDHMRDSVNPLTQEEVFCYHLDLAKRYEKPIIIHCVRAFGAVLDKLKEKTPPAGFLLHSYSGSPEMVKEFAKLGGYFSFGASMLKRPLEKNEAVLAEIPHDRLVLETDSPALPPPKQYAEGLQVYGKSLRNEPFILPRIVNYVADVLKLEKEELTEQLWNNSLQFFAPFL